MMPKSNPTPKTIEELLKDFEGLQQEQLTLRPPHIGLAGWVCPLCRRVLSPYAQTCPCNQMMPFGIPWC